MTDLTHPGRGWGDGWGSGVTIRADTAYEIKDPMYIIHCTMCAGEY